MTLIGAATLCRLPDGHPSITILQNIVTPRLRLALGLLRLLAVIAAWICICVGGFRMMTLQLKQLSPSMEVPMIAIYAALWVGPVISIFWVLWCGQHDHLKDHA
jgi:TRAP-type C4-dicarboxylate transport system permease small subunit